MKFLTYDCEKLEDGNLMLNIDVVDNFEGIFICVNPNSKPITIFDGGSTLCELSTIYNFSSKEFLNKFVEVCKNRKISKNGNVLFLECEEKDFEARLNDLIQAINEICNFED